MTLSGDTDSAPDPGGLWSFTLRFDELPVLMAALMGARLSADAADQAAYLHDRLAALEVQIRKQAR